jgi:hypothetical protein
MSGSLNVTRQRWRDAAYPYPARFGVHAGGASNVSMAAMTKRPHEGGTVRISGKNYVVAIPPRQSKESGHWYIFVRADDDSGHWAKSESWRGGCGPWKLVFAPEKETV